MLLEIPFQTLQGCTNYMESTCKYGYRFAYYQNVMHYSAYRGILNTTVKRENKIY